MGLRIWLPLNGNLENKGLMNVPITNNGATIENNGKFNKCYSFGTEQSYLNISKEAMTSSTEMTVCFWLKILSWNTSYATFFQAGKGGNSWSHYIFGFLRYSSNSTCCFTISDGSTASNGNYLTSNLELNTWYHIGLVYKTGHCLIYINGNLYHDYSTSIVPNFEAITTITVGTANGKGYQSNCLINDLRIYDEALSPMQIKLISQGLVAHYLLNNNGGGNNNLALNSHNLNITATKDNKNISKRGTNVIQLRENGFYEAKVTGNWGGISIYANSLNLQVGDKITFSFYIYTNGSSKAVSFYPMMYNSSGTRDTSSCLPISVDGGTYTALNSKLIGRFDNISPKKHYVVFEWNNAMKSILDNGGEIELSIQISGTWQNGDYVCFFAPKLEYGDKPTPWCPNSEDSLATQLGYNTNIEYDVSGYCHNGTKYNITDYTSDTPRYSVATKFNGTNSYINVGRGGMVRDEITVNIWGYMDDWTKYNSRLISCTEGGGWNFEPVSGGKIHFALGTGNTSNTYKSPTGYTLSELSSGWHMFTGTYDGFTVKQYVDGILNTSIDAYTTKTMIFYNANNSIIIGAEAGGGSSTAGGFFNGYLSDLRIYATALSESDLQSLYNNSGFLDSSGNIYATEYTES